MLLLYFDKYYLFTNMCLTIVNKPMFENEDFKLQVCDGWKIIFSLFPAGKLLRITILGLVVRLVSLLLEGGDSN